MAKPVVSCVMITGHQPERRKLALRSIESFRRQSYQARELVIVNQGEPFSLADANIREIPVVTGKRTLGDLRNIGLLAAEGHLVTPWDDDDYHGPERLVHQVDHGWPNMLQQSLLVNTVTGETKAVSAARWQWHGMPGTLLHPAATPHRYPSLGRDEDSRFAELHGCSRPLVNPAHDYVRYFHGGNTWGADHIAKLAQGARPLTHYELHTVKAIAWWMDHPKRTCKSPADVKVVCGDLRWMGYTTAAYLDRLIREHHVREILEVGHLHGVSTCYFAATGARVTTVDMPHSATYMPRVEDTLAACGLEATIVRRPSRDMLAQAVLEGRQWDLIYVDGSHTLADCWCDVLLGDRLLKAGGWLIMDDIEHPELPGVKQVWERLPAWYAKQAGPTENCGVARKR